VVAGELVLQKVVNKIYSIVILLVSLFKKIMVERLGFALLK